jgi:futalosine hydrolase
MTPIISPKHRCLIALAAPRELDAALAALGPHARERAPHEPIEAHPSIDLVRTGVGKSCAAATVARCCALRPYSAVISAGIAGALPTQHPLPIGSSIAATRSAFADEGVGAPTGFVPLSDMGFAPFDSGDSIHHDPELLDLLASLTDTTGPIATVSWCSGDDQCAQGVATRTGAIAEAMEGAACALAATRADPNIRTAELRVISNTTGNRDTQRWDLDGALANLTDLLGRFIASI